MSDVEAEGMGDLDAAARATSDFLILGHELEFEGVCGNCRPGSTVDEGEGESPRLETLSMEPVPSPTGGPGAVERSQ